MVVVVVVVVISLLKEIEGFPQVKTWSTRRASEI